MNIGLVTVIRCLTQNQQRPTDWVPDAISSLLKEIRLAHRSFLLKAE